MLMYSLSRNCHSLTNEPEQSNTIKFFNIFLHNEGLNNRHTSINQFSPSTRKENCIPLSIYAGNVNQAFGPFQSSKILPELDINHGTSNHQQRNSNTKRKSTCSLNINEKRCSFSQDLQNNLTS